MYETHITNSYVKVTFSSDIEYSANIYVNYILKIKAFYLQLLYIDC